MLKAICINNKPINGCFNEDLHFLREGSTYEGYIDKAIDPSGHTQPCFVVPSIDEGGWAIERFAFLSDLDETTLVNEEFDEKYCVPVNGKV